MTSARPHSAPASRRRGRFAPGARARVPRKTMFQPMLATVGDALPASGDWIYEPKFDGIRILAYADGERVALVSRNGLDKTKQFPEVADAIAALSTSRRKALVLDGEVVALHHGVPARFQQLQSRMHVTDARAIAGHRESTPAAFFAFDVLVDGSATLLAEPWRVRRRHLVQLVKSRDGSGALRLGDVFTDGDDAIAAARKHGWEGVIAKRADARYEPGHRSRAWLKLKLEKRQEFVVGGYTEPRNSREHLGALLLGYYDETGTLVYAGHTGTGFTREGLRDMYARLSKISRKTSPFSTVPRTNQPAHWVRPSVVVEVKFNEWTADGKLRQPVFVGVRDDKDAREVVHEPASLAHGDPG